MVEVGDIAQQSQHRGSTAIAAIAPNTKCERPPRQGLETPV
ncbi:hypothetical protein [Anabaena sp. CS-542/02]|nr:hypothetical protein [Anabaena sp. CS-542/02]MDB9447425.1 hypothetical protein [Anabaena sp. CS-542/02]